MVGNFGDDMLTVAEASLPSWQGRSHHSVLLGSGAERSTSGWMLPPRSYIWLVSE
jgi:hypothetical protein